MKKRTSKMKSPHDEEDPISNQSPNEKISNILIRVPNWLGDTMMATAAVMAVRKIFPQATITVLAKKVYKDFWGNFPSVDQVLHLESGFKGFWRTVSQMKKSSFDAALILPTSFSSAFLTFAAEIPVRIGWGGEGRELFLTHVVPHPEARQEHLVLEYLKLALKGFEASVKGLKEIKLICPVTPEGIRGLKKVWEDAEVPEKQAYIGMAPGATYGAAKRWPLSYWRELIARLLKERSESILILGGLEEETYLRPLLEGLLPNDRSRLHLLAGRTTPPILGAMLSRCKLLVTNDTGPMHVAAAVGTPTVALFGSTSPIWTRPFGIGHEVIYKKWECSPCFQRTCPIGYKCLHAISVDEVYRAVLKKLKKPQKIKAEKVQNLFDHR